MSLLYDLRPDPASARDDRPADAEPTAAEKLAAQTPTIKRWIPPTANRSIGDPAKRHARPSDGWKGDVAYLRPDFDDRGWQRVDLPHDRAIAGPFLTTGPSGGMGRLPSWGIGWYPWTARCRTPRSG